MYIKSALVCVELSGCFSLINIKIIFGYTQPPPSSLEPIQCVVFSIIFFLLIWSMKCCIFSFIQIFINSFILFEYLIVFFRYAWCAAVGNFKLDPPPFVVSEFPPHFYPLNPQNSSVKVLVFLIMIIV